ARDWCGGGLPASGRWRSAPTPPASGCRPCAWISAVRRPRWMPSRRPTGVTESTEPTGPTAPTRSSTGCCERGHREVEFLHHRTALPRRDRFTAPVAAVEFPSPSLGGSHERTPDTAPAGPEASGDDQPALKKAITPKLLLLFIVGDILGTGVYSLTGKV